MEWRDAVAHLPYTMMCTDKRGRILLLNREMDGVRVGKSFLKFAASKKDILAVGRAAKESLSDGKPREVKRAQATNGEEYKVELIPYSVASKRADHLLIILGPPDEEVEPSNWEPTRSRVTPKPPPRAKTRQKPAPPPPSEDIVAAEAHEIIVIAAPEVQTYAEPFSQIIGRRLKTRLRSLADFENSISIRGSSVGSSEIDEFVSAHTRLIFLGRSEFVESVVAGGGIQGKLGAHWKVQSGKVRRAAIWVGHSDVDDLDELLGDLQFEIGQISMKAIPVKTKRGILKDLDPGIELAGAFLEDPGSDLTNRSTTQEQAEEYLFVYAIAMFLTEGLESLLG